MYGFRSCLDSLGLELTLLAGTVLVHLLAASIFRHLALSSPAAVPSIKCVYVRCPSPFPQVEAFVTLCTERYHLDLEAVEGGMRDALEVYLHRHASESGGGIKAVLVGTRRGDPHGGAFDSIRCGEETGADCGGGCAAKLTPFTRTDAGWPDFMRVHPVLDWSYKQIWEFLREPSLTLGGGPVEWCELYDYGCVPLSRSRALWIGVGADGACRYTSLGSTHNTFPNPLLKATDDPAVLGGWRPAWELEDESQERAGRRVLPPLRCPEAY